MSRTPPAAPAALGQHQQVVLGRSAAISSSHPLITTEGARVLAAGGNAIDATLAMAAVSWVVLPGQCGIGGDAFVVSGDRGFKVLRAEGIVAALQDVGKLGVEFCGARILLFDLGDLFRALGGEAAGFGFVDLRRGGGRGCSIPTTGRSVGGIRVNFGERQHATVTG